MLYLNHVRVADETVMSLRVKECCDSRVKECLSSDLFGNERWQNQHTWPRKYTVEGIYLDHNIQLQVHNQNAEIFLVEWTAYRKLWFYPTNKNIPVNLKTKVYTTCALPVTAYCLESKWKNVDETRIFSSG